MSGLLSAQETQSLTLSPDEAVELSLRNNLGLQSARVDTGTRRRASDLSWNQFVPNVTVAGTLNHLNREPMTMPGGPQWQAIATIQTSFNLNAAMFENMRRLRLDYETGILSYNTARLQLERDVRRTYNNMLLLQENIALLQESFQATSRVVDLAQANFLAGRAPELPFLQAQVAMENMRPAVELAEYNLLLAMMQFAMLLGLSYHTPIELVPVTETIEFVVREAPPPDAMQLISQAAARRPEIQELRHTITMLESARRVQSQSLLPNLSLSFSYNPVLLDPWNDSQFRQGGWNDQGSFSITLGMRLHSLFPFSQDFQGIRNMDDQITTAVIGLTQLMQGTELEIVNTLLSLERIRRTAQAQMHTVNLAERVHGLTESAFQAGMQDLLQVQNSELELRQARFALLESQFSYLNGLLDLEYLIGVPFGTLSSR